MSKFKTRDSYPCWIELSSPEPAATQEFFGQLFGWEFSGTGPLGLGTVAHIAGKAVAGLSPQPQEAPADQPGFWTVYFKADDFTSTVEQIGQAGGNAMMAIPQFDGEASVGLFADPNGAGFGVLSFPDERGLEITDSPGAPTWFELHTKDMQVTKFYQSVFNWSFTTVSDNAEFTYSTFTGAGGSAPIGGVVDISNTPIPVHWKPYIRVHNVDDIAQRVVDLGGAILAQPRTTEFGRVCQFIDIHNAALTVIDTDTTAK